MSDVQIEKFMAEVSQDATLMARLSEAQSASSQAFMGRVLEEAAKRGFQFTEAALQTWLSRQPRNEAADELTDGALESLTGGSAGGGRSNITPPQIQALIRGIDMKRGALKR